MEFGAWGKTGINCFVLITGYFMCKSQMNAKKFMKLLLEIYFYRIIIYLLFSATAYSNFSFITLFWLLIPVNAISNDFVGCYLILLLLIPFLNILINGMTEKMHITLILITVGMYTFMGTIPYFTVTMNYVSWFIVLYFISAYIRCYPKKIFTNCKLWGILSILFFTASMASIIICANCYWNNSGNTPLYPYYFLSDSNKIFALIVAICSFLFFANLNIKNNYFINTLGKTTFGILLIHANSDTMRKWLWGDLLNNVAMYDSSLLVIHAVSCVVAIFLICAAIDYLRIKFIESTIFSLSNKIWSLRGRN